MPQAEADVQEMMADYAQLPETAEFTQTLVGAIRQVEDLDSNVPTGSAPEIRHARTWGRLVEILALYDEPAAIAVIENTFPSPSSAFAEETARVAKLFELQRPVPARDRSLALDD